MAGTPAGGILWFGTEAGLFELETGRPGPRPRRLLEDAIEALHVDAAGHLWVAVPRGLRRRAPNAEGFEHHPLPQVGDGSIVGMHSEQDGVLWLASWDAGLLRFAPSEGALSPRGDQGGERLARYIHDPLEPSSLGGPRLLSIFGDRRGHFWVGTWAQGVSHFDPSGAAFEHFHQRPGSSATLNEDTVRSFLEDRRGRFWIGTHGGGLQEWERTRGEFLPDPRAPTDPGDGYIYALHEDRAGRLWVGLGNGLDQLDPTRRRLERRRHDPEDPDGIPPGQVRRIVEDADGFLWMVLRGGGLSRLDPESDRFITFSHNPDDPESLSSDTTFTMLIDSAGAVWAGTMGGLDRLDRPAPNAEPSGRFVHFRHDPNDPRSLRRDDVYSLHEATDGVFWVGTGGAGLHRLDSDEGNGRFTAYTVADGLADGVVYDILEDGLGRLWLSSNKGLTRFDPATGHCRIYDPGDGLQHYEFNLGAAFRAPDGAFYFGGVEGFNRFRPERFVSEPTPPRVTLTSFQVFQQDFPAGRDVPYLDEVELGYRQNFFAFEFAALSYRRSDKNRYSYRLEGLEADWSPPGARRYAAYTSVPPGDYVFRVRAANDEGVWSEAPTGLRVVVAPPPWATWWAYAFYVALAVLVPGSFMVWQRRKVEREREINRRLECLVEDRTRDLRERERLLADLERFNYTVSHDLRNPLVTIQNFAGALRRDLTSDDRERIDQDVATITAAADEMHRLLDALIGYSQVGYEVRTPVKVRLSELAAAALQRSMDDFVEHGFDLDLGELPDVVGDPVLLLIVFRRLIENAVQFIGDTTTPRLEIGFRARDRAVYVRDNGLGIDSAYREKIFGLFERLDANTPGAGIGLALAKRIVEAHGGEIWVESEGRGRGSTFYFTLEST